MQTDLGLTFLADTAVHKMSWRAKEKMWKFMGKYCEEIYDLKRCGLFKSCATVRRRLDRHLPTIWLTYLAIHPDTGEETLVTHVTSMDLQKKKLERSWIHLEIGHIKVRFVSSNVL